MSYFTQWLKSFDIQGLFLAPVGRDLSLFSCPNKECKGFVILFVINHDVNKQREDKILVSVWGSPHIHRSIFRKLAEVSTRIWGR